MGRCPFHGDRSPSFSVNQDFYYCFGCKETGDAISFMTKLHGMSFEEACEDLAEKAKLTIPESAYQLSSEEEKAIYQKRLRSVKGARLNHFASVQFYHQNLLKNQTSPLFQEAREYLKKRGISSQTIDHFQIGVAGAQFDGLVEFLTHAKAPLDLARDFGLIRPSQRTSGDYDFFRERLLFPLIDIRGRVCGFGGRILPSVDARPSEMKLPKYLNSAESELFQKSKFLYGFYQARRAIREEEVAILVEGYFDVISLHQAGIENVVAPCGTSLTEDHLKMLLRVSKRLIVFFDQDEAGITATVKSMEMGLKNGVLLYGIQFESKLDPDEFLLLDPVENLKKLKEWIASAQPLLDQSIDRLFRESEHDVEKRSQAIKQATAWLTAYADPVGRAVRVDSLIKKWKVPEVALGALAKSVGSSRPMIPLGRDPAVPASPLEQNPNRANGSSSDRRRAPFPLFDRQLLPFLVKFSEFGPQFLEAKKQLPDQESIAVLFQDPEIKAFVGEMSEDLNGFSKLRLAPETLLSTPLSPALQSLMMEGLLSEASPGDQAQLQGYLNRAIHKAWKQVSDQLGVQMRALDEGQDPERFRQLSEQFLALQRKLKEFQSSFASGKTED